MHIRSVLVLCFAVLPVKAEDPKDAPKNKELIPLQGVWTLEGVEANGMARELPVRAPRWLIKGDKIVYGGMELAALTIQGGSDPKGIDLTTVMPKGSYEGVFAVDKDKLKICVNLQGEGVKERPLNFDTEGKPERRLFVFKRDAKDADPNEGLTGFVGIQVMVDEKTSLVTVGATIDDSPAKKAGLMKDDIVLMVGTEKATDLRTTVALIRQLKPGSEIVIRVKRGEKEMDVKVKVGVFPFHYLVN